MNNKLYQDKLMHHFKYPKNKKKISNPDFSSQQQNPSCGDDMLVEGTLVKDENTGKLIIKDLGFQGSGCVISLAAASMLTDYCIGKTVEDVLQLNKDDILKLIGLELGPNRIKCALLCLQALKVAFEKYRK